MRARSRRDDYLVKPFELPVLLARMRAVMRRANDQAFSLLTPSDARPCQPDCDLSRYSARTFGTGILGSLRLDDQAGFCLARSLRPHFGTGRGSPEQCDRCPDTRFAQKVRQGRRPQRPRRRLDGRKGPPMKSLRSTVMFYVTILLVAVSVAAAVTSYYFVKYEVNSFQGQRAAESPSPPAFCFGTTFGRASCRTRRSTGRGSGIWPGIRSIVPGPSFRSPSTSWVIPT